MSDDTGFDLLSLKPDKNLAEEGVWIDFFGNSRLKIAQAQNKKHQEFINLQFKAHRRKLNIEDKNADELGDKISIEGAARYLLKDWENIKIDGVITKYTVKLGIKVMTEVPTLRNEVTDQSNRLQNFQIAEELEDMEDVKPTSPGSSSGEDLSD